MALETLLLKAACCSGYHEAFAAGDVENGAYVCHLVLSDPDGFTIQAGEPGGAFVAPMAREHGVPGVAPLASPPTSGIASDCTESVRQNLQNQVRKNCKNGKQSCLITDK